MFQSSSNKHGIEYARPFTVENLRPLVVGIEEKVPLLDGSTVTYVNFDNAASTPTFKPVCDHLSEFLKWYSNVHRGTGFKSQLSSWVFEQARDSIAEFVGADLKRHVALFTKNTTEAINKLAYRLPLSEGDVVLTSLMEHHSNELPWRRVAKVKHIGLEPDGTLSWADFREKLAQNAGRVKLVAITGASNVTGYLNDIHRFAEAAHDAGAQILIDAAQLCPHRPVSMRPIDDPGHLDYLVFSAHKMYAPFGIGLLVGLRETFEEGDPETVGGGMVDIVNLEEAYWAELPDKEEAGTPDIVGVMALARMIEIINEVGWDDIIRHEADLTAYALERLAGHEWAEVYGDRDPSRAAGRLGVISFNVKGVPHNLAAAILNYEGGIGVRAGCFCAHTYVKKLLHIDPLTEKQYEEEIRRRNRSNIPGTIRMSFGLYNTREEIDRLCTMVERIGRGEYSGTYKLNVERGEYYPEGYTVDFREFFAM
jgi:cysteine desulfurase/selenocysteine lyase